MAARSRDIRSNNPTTAPSVSFYNTTNETGAQLDWCLSKANNQSGKVFDYFVTHRGLNFSPSQVHRALGGRWPITSTRRTMTDLAADGLLVKTSDKVMGPYGRAEYQWSLFQGLL